MQCLAHINFIYVYCVQVYRHCSQIDISGLKDPRLHDQTIISALYNLGRLLDDDGRHQVALLSYIFCAIDVLCTDHLYAICTHETGHCHLWRCIVPIVQQMKYF